MLQLLDYQIFALTFTAIGILGSLFLALQKKRTISKPTTIAVHYGVRAESIGHGMLVAVGGGGGCDGVVEVSPQHTIKDVMDVFVSSGGVGVARDPNDTDDETKLLPWDKPLVSLGINNGDTLYIAYIGGLGGRGDDRATESEIYHLLFENPKGTLTLAELERQLALFDPVPQEPLEYYLKLLEKDELIVRRDGAIVACTHTRYSFSIEYPQPLIAGDDCLFSVSLNYMKHGTAVPQEDQTRIPATDLYLRNGYVTFSRPIDNTEAYRLMVKPECSSADIRPHQREVTLADDWHYATDIHGHPIQFKLQFASAGHKTLVLQCLDDDKVIKSVEVPLAIIERAFSLGKWTVSSTQFALIQFIFGLIRVVGVVIAALLALVH